MPLKGRATQLDLGSGTAVESSARNFALPPAPRHPGVDICYRRWRRFRHNVLMTSGPEAPVTVTQTAAGDEDRRRWVSAPATRILIWVVILGYAAAGLTLGGVSWAQGDAAGAAWVPIIGLAMAAGHWWFCFRPFIEASGSGLVVRNLVFTSSIPWVEFASAEGGAAGLVIRKRDGGAVTAIAVEKANLFILTGTRRRADQVADEINGLAQRWG